MKKLLNSVINNKYFIKHTNKIGDFVYLLALISKRKISIFILLMLLLSCYNSTNSINNSSTNNLYSQNPTSTNQTPSDIVIKQDILPKEFTCNNKELLGIWNEIWKDNFLKEFFENGIPEGDCAEYLDISRMVDLNDDGKKELIVKGKGRISAASTMPIWVIQKNTSNYKILLQEQGEFYKIEKTKTNGYRDLYFPSRRTVMSSFLSTYKFKEGVYHRSKCQVEFFYEESKFRKIFNCNDKKRIKDFEDKFTH